MTDIVDAAEIERIVGARRHPDLHLGRAVSSEGRVYILHSQYCLDSGIDLRECRYSQALDRSIEIDADPEVTWSWCFDVPVLVGVSSLFGDLIPIALVQYE